MTIIFHVHIAPRSFFIILCTKLQILFNRDDEMRDDTMCECMMDGLKEWFVKAFSMKMKNTFFDVKMMKLYYIHIHWMSNKFLLDEIFIQKIVCCLMKSCYAMLWELLLFMSVFKCFCFILFYILILPTYTINMRDVKLLLLTLFWKHFTSDDDYFSYVNYICKIIKLHLIYLPFYNFHCNCL